MQNISFGTLHIRPEDNRQLGALIKTNKDKKVFDEACAKIDKASGDCDVYLRTGDFNGPAYVPLQIYYEGRVVSAQLCNPIFIDNQMQFKDLASDFDFCFNNDSRFKKHEGSENTRIDNIFDTYA